MRRYRRRSVRRGRFTRKYRRVMRALRPYSAVRDKPSVFLDGAMVAATAGTQGNFEWYLAKTTDQLRVAFANATLAVYNTAEYNRAKVLFTKASMYVTLTNTNNYPVEIDYTYFRANRETSVNINTAMTDAYAAEGQTSIDATSYGAEWRHVAEQMSIYWKAVTKMKRVTLQPGKSRKLVFRKKYMRTLIGKELSSYDFLSKYSYGLQVCYRPVTMSVIIGTGFEVPSCQLSYISRTEYHMKYLKDNTPTMYIDRGNNLITDRTGTGKVVNPASGQVETAVSAIP